MKLLLNNYYGIDGEGNQELPIDTLVEYIAENKDRYRVSANENGDGIVISFTQHKGAKGIAVLPKYANQIEVRPL